MASVFDTLLGKLRKKDGGGAVTPPGTYIEVSNNGNNVNGGLGQNDVVIVAQLEQAIANLPTVVKPRGTFEIILGTTAQYPKAIATNAVNALQVGNGSGTGPSIKAGDAWRVIDTGLVGSGVEVDAGDFIIANVDNAGNNDADWYIQEGNSPIINITSANLLTLISSSRVVVSQNYRITDKRNAIVMGIANNAVSTATEMLITANEYYNPTAEWVKLDYDIISDEVYNIEDSRLNEWNFRISFVAFSNILSNTKFGKPNIRGNEFWNVNVYLDENIIFYRNLVRDQAYVDIHDATGLNSITVENCDFGGFIDVRDTANLTKITNVYSSSIECVGTTTISNVQLLTSGSYIINTDSSVLSAEVNGNITISNNGVAFGGRFDGIHNLTGSNFISGNFFGTSVVNTATNGCLYNGITIFGTNLTGDATQIFGGLIHGAVVDLTNCSLGSPEFGIAQNITLNSVFQNGLRCVPGYSNIEVLVDITGLSTLDLTAYPYAGIIRVNSANVTETLTQIIGYNEAIPFSIRPEDILTSLFINHGTGFGQPRIEGGLNRELDGSKGDNSMFEYFPAKIGLFEIYSSSY